jgi:hypothetical protein
MALDSVMPGTAAKKRQRLKVSPCLVLGFIVMMISWGSTADARARENPGCPEWESLAVEVGWLAEDLPMLGRIMWAESRCIPDVVSSTNDFGLLQVNKAVWQSDLEQIGYEMSDLLEPRAGLKAGLYVANRFEAHGRCKWEAWQQSGSWCNDQIQVRPFGQSRGVLAFSGADYFLPLVIAGIGLTPWICKKVRLNRRCLIDEQCF